jgi:CBS domain-containing protein
MRGKGGFMKKIVSDIMTKDPACCTPEMDLVEAAQLMLKNDCGEIPVVYSLREKKVLGVITDRDICTRAVAVGLNTQAMHVEQCMSYPPIVVRDTISIEDCCVIMEENQIRRLPVVNQDENCCGIISLADIAKSQRDDLAAEVIKKISLPATNSLLH